jgi:hypothetical protein
MSALSAFGRVNLKLAEIDPRINPEDRWKMELVGRLLCGELSRST